MSKVLLLLQLVLVGCRDAAYRRNLPRANVEFVLALAVRCALAKMVVDQAQILRSALETYATLADDVVQSRAETYRGLVKYAIDEPLETSQVLSSPMFAGIVRCIDYGLARARNALEKSDLQRCEIELEHIHNLPSLLDTTIMKSQGYYLEKQVPFFLDSLEKNYGLSIRKEAIDEFEATWKQMQS